MNIYRTTFEIECPNNSHRIRYHAEIATQSVIMVERIYGHFASLTSAFHEDIADSAFEAFGGRQVIKAHHHGVDVETIRGNL